MFANRPPGDKLLRLKEVLEILTISKSNWYQGVREGRYPSSLTVGTRSARWWSSDIYGLLTP